MMCCHKPQRSSSLHSRSALRFGAQWNTENIPELDCDDSRRTTLMCRLVIGTPGSDSVSKMTALVLDLSEVTHGLGELGPCGPRLTSADLKD